MKIDSLLFRAFTVSMVVFTTSCLVLPGQARSVKRSTETQKTTKTDKADTVDPKDIKVRLTAMETALSEGDAKKVAAFWTEDGSYTNETGSRFTGRTALEKRFSEVFSTSGRPFIEFSPESCKFLSADIALSEGLVRRKDGANKAPETRYSIVFQKSNGVWLISSAVETALDSASEAQQPLSDLSWLIGEWSANNAGGSVHLKADWAANKNFISLVYQIKKPSESNTVESRQVIGWDPLTEQPISWQFDENGGYGQGVWHRRGGKWVIQASGIDRDGIANAATNIITVSDDKSFQWQSVDRTVNGVSYNDTEPLKVERVVK